ncbi:MAG: hypothetical protein ACRCT8_05055 [Lacipirellulaceae bacterium]
MLRRPLARLALPAVALLATLAAFLAPTPAAARLLFYYDPDTGNVAFDTRNSESGELYGYTLNIDPNLTPVRFRSENLARLRHGSLTTSVPLTVGHATLSTPFRGLLTIGDVLPPGLSEDVWRSLLSVPYDLPDDHPDLSRFYSDNFGPSYGWHSVVQWIGDGGYGLVPDFVYGRPDRPFDNRFDAIDPDTLPWASRARLVYQAWNGELLLDTTGEEGGHISMFRLVSDGRFLAENWTPPLQVPLTTGTSSTLFLAANAIDPGVHSLGRVLPAGLSDDEFRAFFTESNFIGRIGFRRSNLDFATHGQPFALAHEVPEPCAGMMGALALCALASPHRQPSA